MTKKINDTDSVGIAGTGKIAQALGALLTSRGMAIRAIAGRRAASAEEAARFTGAARAVAITELPQWANRIVIAVADGAIPAVAAQLAEAGLRGGIVLHTSGAAGPEALDALRAAGNAVGVLHPLQTVPSARHGVAALPGSTYAFAGDAAANEWASSIVALLDGQGLRVDPAYWPHYHAGAVMACNYQATLVDAALELMALAGLDRGAALTALGPILRATVENVLESGPQRALTGPIRRGDAGTIRRHMAALDAALPETRALYAAAGLRTLPVASRAGLDADGAREVAAALGQSR